FLCNEDTVPDPPISSTKTYKHQPEWSPICKLHCSEEKEINDPDWECVLVRDRDLRGLQSGETQSSRTRKSTNQTRREAFTRYVELLYRQPLGIVIPEDDSFDLLTALCSPKPSEPQPLIPPLLQDGFFPNRSQATKRDEVKSDHPRQKTPGFVPNSVLAGRLWPDVVMDEVPPTKPWTLQADLGHDLMQSEMDERQFEEYDSGSPVHLLETPPKPQCPTPPPAPAPPPAPPQPKKMEYMLKPLKPLPPIKKDPPPPPQTLPPFPPKPDTPPPPHPSSPQLPHFLCQFLQEQWFCTMYPDRRSIPETLSATEFCDQLLDFLKCCSLEHKLCVLRAIVTLHTQGLLDNIQHITHTLLALHHTIRHSNMMDKDGFATELLNFLVCVNPHSYDITVELLTLLANKELRLQGIARGILQALGVDDAQRWILPQLQPWQGYPQQTLREAAYLWLHSWAEQYRVLKRPALVQDAQGKSVVAPAEVLCYFCWIQREAQTQPPPPPLEGRKDTVRLDTRSHRWEAVQRLGETHTMSRLREPQGLVLPPLVSRPFLMGFTRLLSLPLPRVTLSSFPFSLDPHCLREALPQRYFILERSYTHYYR
ncbi:hypothetical protein P4O66_008804, partial [Electrophorus voltai]